MGKYAELGASFKTIELAIEDIRLALGDIKKFKEAVNIKWKLR